MFGRARTAGRAQRDVWLSLKTENSRASGEGARLNPSEVSQGPPQPDRILNLGDGPGYWSFFGLRSCDDVAVSVLVNEEISFLSLEYGLSQPGVHGPAGHLRQCGDSRVSARGGASFYPGDLLYHHRYRKDEV